MKQKNLDLMLEDILNANIVQLNGESLSVQMKNNEKSMVFSVILGQQNQDIAEFTLNYDSILSVEHKGIGNWKINRYESEQLSLQCFAFQESGIAFISGSKI